MGRVVARRRIERVSPRGIDTRPDSLAVEEPLELRVGGGPVTVTMRTPGDDFDLVRGFLVAEAIARQAADITTMRYCGGATRWGVNTYNVVDVTLAPHLTPPAPRAFLTTSACGVCGSESVDAVRARTPWPVSDVALTVPAEVLCRLPDKLRAAQRVFDRTGGLHAAGLFTAQGQLLCAREDVGRHNAVDKVIGWALRAGLLPLRGCVLQVSGRASFELAQKAVMAGIPVLSAVSAPSSLAVDLATETGLTLCGFVREHTMNVYSHPGRIT